MFMVMMMSSSSSIAATKSMTVRLSHSRSPANVVASVRAMSFLLNGSICAATLSKMSDRKSVVSGKSVSVRVDLGGRRIIKKKTKKANKHKRDEDKPEIIRTTHKNITINEVT